MGFRPGQAKAPYCGPRAGGSSGGLTNIPTWIDFSFTHTQFQTAGTTNSIALYTLPAKGIIGDAKLYPSVAFAGTGITLYEISAGIAGSLEELIAFFDVTQAQTGAIGNMVNIAAWYNNSSTKALLVSARSTGANLDQSTAGTVIVSLLLSKTTT